MLVDRLKYGFLPFKQGRRVGKVDSFSREFLLGKETILVFLRRWLLFLIGHAHYETLINLHNVAGDGIPQAVSRRIAIQSVELLDVFEIVSILCKLSELDSRMWIRFEEEGVEGATRPELCRDIKS